MRQFPIKRIFLGETASIRAPTLRQESAGTDGVSAIFITISSDDNNISGSDLLRLHLNQWRGVNLVERLSLGFMNLRHIANA
jgi:hypothetical protein